MARITPVSNEPGDVTQRSGCGWARGRLHNFGATTAPIAHKRYLVAIDSQIAHQEPAKGFNNLGFSSKPSIKVWRDCTGIRGRRRGLPQQLSVDIHVLQI